MTLDGFLTFLTLAVGIYALASPVERLRARLKFAIQAPVAILALSFVLYFEFGQPCLIVLGSTCDWLVFTADDAVTPPQLAFLVVLGWMVLALMIHRFIQRGVQLPMLSRLVDELIYNQRYPDIPPLVEPCLRLISRAARRKLLMQRMSDHLSRMKHNEVALHHLLSGNKGAQEREAQRSAIFKRLRLWTGSLAVFVPTQRKAETAASNILDALLRAGDLRCFVIQARPYFGISLLKLDVHGYEKREFSHAYFSTLISDSSSVLYQEIERNQYISGAGTYLFPENNRLLYFLFSDARVAEDLQVWKPIGDHLLELLMLDARSEFIAHLNRRPDYFDSECWRHPIYAGISFFDMMVKAAAFEGVQWHMWLYYFPLLIERLEALYDTSDPSIDTSREFPTFSARLIYDAVDTLCRWVCIIRDLPEDSSHRQSDALSEQWVRKWNPWANDNGNIPVSAAIALGSCMATVAMSDRIGEKFRTYMLEVVIGAIGRLRREGDEGRFRSFLIQSVINGGQRTPGHQYAQRLRTLCSMVDPVDLSDVDDYTSALEAALTPYDDEG